MVDPCDDSDIMTPEEEAAWKAHLEKTTKEVVDSPAWQRSKAQILADYNAAALKRGQGGG